MTDQDTSTAASGVAAQRERRHLQHQSVPGDALGTAAAPVAKGDAAEVEGATVTTVGQGFLSFRGHRFGG